MNFLYDSKGIFNITMIITSIVAFSILIGFILFNNPVLFSISFKWFQTSAFFIVALIAQTFFKLNDTKEQTKILESEFNRIQADVSDRTARLLRVLIFYVLSAIILSAIHSSIEPIIPNIAKASTSLTTFIKFTYIISISYLLTWTFSIYNAYKIYQDITDLKAQIALGEIRKEGRKKALDRLMGKS
ncbi:MULTISPECIES: hypothetical protein [unclassified Moraxella]|uniref:hypothetical protein n=1 Tax=unclassified Moraxella TaxID=2685852 RepID=UPI003AF603E0